MNALKEELKILIVNECEKDINPADIKDDEILFGSDSAIGLDSLDALQISMALKAHYNIKVTDSKKIRKIMKNINSLAAFIDGK